ncbi:MAG: hypothetical protein ACTHM1_05720 [Solirubrobacteraceae bacterium]
MTLAISLALALLVPTAAHALQISEFSTALTAPGGAELSQAGAHPDVTTLIRFKTHMRQGPEHPYEMTDGNPKDIEVNMPPGVIGDPGAVPTCTQEQLRGNGFASECPIDTQVGTNKLVFCATFSEQCLEWPVPVYNMKPPTGEPAQFAFNLVGVLVFVNISIRDQSDYGVTARITGISQGLALQASKLTLWGVPADPIHDAERGGPSTAPRLPLMTAPTTCSTSPLLSSMSSDSWQEPGSFERASSENDIAGDPMLMSGCERLAFEPSIRVAPDTSSADTPAGLTVDVKVPQDGLTNADGLAPADLKDTTVTLPSGVAINPGQAAGLIACQPSEAMVGSAGPAHCPSASKVGTVSIATPLLPNALEGNVYILPSDPPHLQLLVAASADGVNLKLVGNVKLDPHTGQLTTTFSNTPQLPFTDFKLAFSGGAQAALSTPATCGTYTTNTDFTPWTTPHEPDRLSSDSFAITSGPGGSACVSQLPFAPTMQAGSTTDQAGGLTGFSMLIQRSDGQQRISKLQFKTPEGLLGMISRVPLCAEPQAAQGTCPATTQIGHTVVQAGAGPYPLVIPQPGQPPAPIYLTGPYDGAPYGLAIVVPVVAGPFNLGTIVVRATIRVDPQTSQLTITTDELPSVLAGVPANLRTIDAVIDRPGFMFNPTSCAPMSFSGTATSTEGASAPLTSHFQVGSCRGLNFKPKFTASTQGATSRKDGASLHVALTYPKNSLGKDANIKSVHIELPKVLPSRLNTLNHACVDSVFDRNPADCPSESRVGFAKAVTPVLSSPLEGPAYFVSHGGQRFPELIVVLQGEGITVDLRGETAISKTGITSSTFRAIPDVPVGSFELTLPQGSYSALAANTNLCRSAKTATVRKVVRKVRGGKRKVTRKKMAAALVMPTTFTAQNGATLRQDTMVRIVGCANAKHKRK